MEQQYNKKHLNNEESEINFLKDNQERILGIVGCKGSGKTHTILKLLEFYMNSNIHNYSEHHLILPSYLNENDKDQYNFLKNRKDVYIYTKYSPLVLKKIYVEQLKESVNGKKIVLVIDDSSQYGQDLSTDKNFISIMTMSRHLKIKLIIAVHTLKKILCPVIRMNLDGLMIFKITNNKLLNDAYDEFFSMYGDFKNYQDFKKFYFDNVFCIKHNFIFLNILDNMYSCTGKDFNFINYNYPEKENAKGKIKTIEVDDEKDKIMQKIEIKTKQQQMIEAYNKMKNKK